MTLRERPEWKVGMVTAAPTMEHAIEELSSLSEERPAITEDMLYHIEILNVPDAPDYVSVNARMPLHLLRPLAYWRDCLGPLPEAKWHPTVHRALEMASTYSIVSDYFAKARETTNDSLERPRATIFCRAMFVGPELILKGDCLKLPAGNGNAAMDALVVSSIKVNLLEPSNDSDGQVPKICVHVSGHALTLDPQRARFDAGGHPMLVDTATLPPTLTSWGQWFNMTDPIDKSTKLEIQFSRLQGRYHESAALKAWYASPATVNDSKSSELSDMTPDLDTTVLGRTSESVLTARLYSVYKHPQIDHDAGEQWRWASDRYDQLGYASLDDDSAMVAD